jgi:hypothetical protein
MNASSASDLSRREFLKRSAVAAGALSAPWFVPATARGAEGTAPSERVTVGLIGNGLMGQGHLRRLAGDSKFQVLAVCDPDRERRESGRNYVDTFYGAQTSSGTYRGCTAYNDYRELLACADIDAVVIVTPDHWHALQSIDAARAGKDIYCEKPISMTLQEGRRVVEAVRRYGRVFQTGSQYRSISTIRQICQFVREGKLGRVKSVFSLWSDLGILRGPRFKPYAHVVNADKNARSCVPLDFPLPAEPVPEGLDWDMWVGPATWRPYNPVYHANPAKEVVPWAFCEDFGAASSTWHVSHAIDVLHYAMGMETSGPIELIHPSTKEFPSLTCRYANGTLLHLVSHWGVARDVYKAVPPATRLDGMFGGIIVGERGWITTMSNGGPIEAQPESLFDEINLPRREVSIGSNNHHANWLECIRTRQPPSSHEEIGHGSAAFGQLVDITFRLGRSLRWDPVKEEFIGSEAANRLRSRAMRVPWRI